MVTRVGCFKEQVAMYEIAVPKNVNFNHLEEWPRWIRKFEWFRQMSGLSEKKNWVKLMPLIYTMGGDVDDILSLLGLNDEDKGKYDMIKEKF